jgi:hypothetical protein
MGRANRLCLPLSSIEAHYRISAVLRRIRYHGDAALIGLRMSKMLKMERRGWDEFAPFVGSSQTTSGTGRASRAELTADPQFIVDAGGTDNLRRKPHLPRFAGRFNDHGPDQLKARIRLRGMANPAEAGRQGLLRIR